MTVQIEHALRLERELADARKRVASALRESRQRTGLSLRQVSKRVRLSAPTISVTERGMTWESKTVQRLVRFYERHEETAAADAERERQAANAA